MSNIQSKRWLLNRRHFLRGLGATVALPLLDCMKPFRAVAAEAAKPRRAVFVYIPNGVNVLTWQITKAGRDYEFSTPMRPLEKHRANITPISGLHHPGGLGTAHVCGDLWLTGAKLSQEGGAYRNSVSCDQLMAEVTSVHTRFPSLELSVAGGTGAPGNVINTLSWSRDGIPLPAEDNPKNVFNRLFGEESGGVEVRRRRLNRRHSVLDLVLDDARSLRRGLNQDDRTKLDEYLTAVREVEVRTERLDAWLNVPKPKLEPSVTGHFQRDVSKAQAGEYFRTMYDLIVLALRTDMTRVITYMSGTEGYGLAIPEIGITQTRHELSHHNGDPEIMARLSKSDAFITEQFSYFLDQLTAARDGEDSLLDRTMVLFGSGMSYGHSHGNANLPTIVAGARALGFKHGQHIDYNLPKINSYDLANAGTHYGICGKPVNDKAHLSNLLLTMLQKMEVNAERFVDSLGPVSEIV
ncbi:MAG: hypothetical protein JWM16_1292 [Verrucomicrobiales bacterium]|nr:hypothetical protein [Verrucomicrobiales bacterium]